jgi:hypothetical protein
LQNAPFAGKIQGMRKFLPAILLCCMLSPAPAVQRPEKWTQVEVWRQQLGKGMTDRDVLKILGEPKDKEISRSTMAWYYQGCPERIRGYDPCWTFEF